MTRVKILSAIEGSNVAKNDTKTLFELSNDRTDIATGGFLDNWDATVSSNANNSPTPFKLISYKLRVYTSKPCIIYSAVAENLRVAKTAPGGVDTDFHQRTMANGIIKKFSLTNYGRTWSTLSARPKSPSGRGPQRFNDATWKLQLKNIDPVFHSVPEDHDAAYYAVIEAVIDYDATSTA
ncbi:MAG: hypothetical protein [Circular genetic element sp.]|nr:MAG: hypothetical protein [Circular genetic element sp.]